MHITGDGMAADALVTVAVDRPDGVTDSGATVAASDGTFAYDYVLPGPDAPVIGEYHVSATDGTNTFETTFWDGTVTSAPLTIDQSNCSTSSSAFTSGDTVCASAGPITTNPTATGPNGINPGTGDFRVYWFAPDWITGNPPTFDDPFTDAINGHTYTASHVVTTTGTWTVKSCRLDNIHPPCDASTPGLFLDSRTFTVNAATPTGPTASAGGPYNTTEGTGVTDGVQLDASGSTGTGTLSYVWSVDTTGIDAGGTCSFNDNTLVNPVIKCTDDSLDATGGHFSVTVQVTDDNGTDSDSANLTVGNANPVVSTPTVVSQSNCSVNVSALFTDAGTNDTHTGSFSWGDASSSAGSVTESSGSGSLTGSHTYSAPGVYSITATVTDDDLGSGTSSALSFNNNPVVQGWPNPPIMPGKVFNTGSTIPVKIIVTGCTAGETLRLSATGSVTVKPAGKANFQDYLRYTPTLPGYIYNLNTKGWPTGYYDISVTFYGPFTGVYKTTIQLVK